jgi:hypothetical protein
LATSATLFTGDEIVRCELFSSLFIGEPTRISFPGVPSELEVVAIDLVVVCFEDLPEDPVIGTYWDVPNDFEGVFVGLP